MDMDFEIIEIPSPRESSDMADAVWRRRLIPCPHRPEYWAGGIACSRCSYFRGADPTERGIVIKCSFIGEHEEGSLAVINDRVTLSSQLWAWVVRYDVDDVVKSSIIMDTWVELIRAIAGKSIRDAEVVITALGLQPNSALTAALTRDLIVESIYKNIEEG